MGNFDGLPKTTYIKLNKPGYDNAADIEALNENADIVDALLQRLLLTTDNIKKTYARTVNGNGVNSNGEVTVDVGVKKLMVLALIAAAMLRLKNIHTLLAGLLPARMTVLQ